MVYIVGLGPGHRDYMTLKALRTLENSSIIVGFRRAIDSIDFIKSNKKIATSLNEVLELINNEPFNKNISVIASGDPLFFGITDYIKKNYQGHIQVISGLTSFQYLVAKTNLSWGKAYIGSLHGREDDFIKRVEENSISIWLCDKKNTPQSLCRLLVKEKIHCEVIVGENLSYDDERIECNSPGVLMEKQYSDLSVIVVRR